MELSLKQSQTLSLAMQTSLHILQLNNIELRNYVCDLMLRNPVVELDCPKIEYESSPFTRQKPSSAVRSDNGNAEETQEPPVPDTAEEHSALHDLNLQSAAMNLSVQDTRIMRYLIESLDENGFLKESCSDIAKHLHASEEAVQRCISLLQSMEPAGIGAADLRDCLRLQLHRLFPEDTLAPHIVDIHLEQMANHQYAAIAKALGVTKAAVMQACDNIRSLNPKPLNGSGGDIVTHYIIPDFYVFCENDQLSCTINDYFLPKISIDPTYQKLLDNKELSPEDTEYLQKNYREANDITGFITYRKSTLQRVVEYVMQVQKDFFLYGPGHQAALTNKDIAQALSVHESTVSRAVAGKFFECQWGVFPLKSLFSRNLNQDDMEQKDVSSAWIMQRLQELVAAEPDGKAYSDQQLVELLETDGVQIARRTVSKYRQKLGIPSASRRNAKFT